jgi:hypothetical protein
MTNGTEQGKGVDSKGNPVVDPTKNVLDLVDASVRRIDDLANLRAIHTKEIADIRDRHYRELSTKEASRLDSIQKAALDAIQANAKQVTDLAASIASSTATTFEAMAKRIAALELSSAEGIGKTRVVDPQIEALVDEVRSLATTRSEKTGSSDQSKAIWGYVLGGVGLVIGVVSFFLRLG